MGVLAEDSGGVQASAAQIGMTPAMPSSGDDVIVSVTLYNSNPTEATGVEVRFYKNTYGDDSTLIRAKLVNVPAQGTEIVSETWAGVPEGNQTIWFTFRYGGQSSQAIYRTFEVQGRPDLAVTDLTVVPESTAHEGDQLNVSSVVRNVGSRDAGASTLRYQIDGASGSFVDVAVPALEAGASTHANATLTAPSTGAWTIHAIPDLDDVIIEAVETSQGAYAQGFVVIPRPDLLHQGVPTVTVERDDLDGPWSINGTVVMENASGPLTATLAIRGPSGSFLGAPFTVQFDGIGTQVRTWSQEITDAQLSGSGFGAIPLTVEIDPLGVLQQERTDNDGVTVALDRPTIPDVVVDRIAIADPSTANAGGAVQMSVTVQNVGDIRVAGRLAYDWEGRSELTEVIGLEPNGESGSTREVVIDLIAGLGTHTATFSARWVAEAGSWDADASNNDASGTVAVREALRMTWLEGTSNLTPSEVPLQEDTSYTFRIGLATEGLGEVVYRCIVNDVEVSNTTLRITERGAPAELECALDAAPPATTLEIRPDDIDVNRILTKVWTVERTSGEVVDDLNSNRVGTAALIGFVTLVLIGVLVAAVILTRPSDGDVDRDIYEYCPACDGELDGDEEECPHCGFDLQEASRKTADCTACGENIPAMLDYCPFCGVMQDPTLHFERRKRTVVPLQIDVSEEIPEPEDPDVDLEVEGMDAAFAETIEEFGYEVEQLEEEWESNLASAEEEMERVIAQMEEESEIANRAELGEDEGLIEQTVQPTLRSIEDHFADHDLDAMLEGRELTSRKDDGNEELDASDAEIRAQLFEITGEEGVLPGQDVVVGMSLTDSTIAGNQVPDQTMDFSFEDEEPVSTEPVKDSGRRRVVRRKKEAAPKPEMAECGSCGASIPADATSCQVCGARFE